MATTAAIVESATEDDARWRVRYSDHARANERGDAVTGRVVLYLVVERATGRVHRMDFKGRGYLTHPPHPAPPGARADG